MDEDEPQEVNFVDIAQRRSEVLIDVNPSRLLLLSHRYQDPKTKRQVDCQLLRKAVMDGDFEGFVQIADLYKSLPKPLDLPSEAIKWAIEYDRPDMLDELIRRTGGGIELPEESSDDDAPAEGEKKKTPPKTYLGLNVHGKKRKDLVQKSDPNAPTSYKKHEFPLLWTAAHDGAEACVCYLSSERPLSAYQYYASTHGDEKAQYLKRINEQIPERLGWNMDDLNESVITATVIGDRLRTLQVVIDLQPAQLQSALMARYVPCTRRMLTS